MVIYLAGYLVRQQKEVRDSWMGFFKPFIVLLPMAGLLLMEPDFGATVVMMGAAAAMLFLGGVGLFRFALMVALALARSMGWRNEKIALPVASAIVRV